jgi:glycosyltransferase involved in cell wall biosynthesis
VPYRTFPFAGRKGTTVIDRSSAYPLFGWRAGRRALRAVKSGHVDVVYAAGASGYGYAAARERGDAAAPFVLNPHGLEEFVMRDAPGDTSRLKQIAYAPLRRIVRRSARAADAVIATDRALEPLVVRHLSVTPDRVRVVPNAIDVKLTAASAPHTDRARVDCGIAESDLVLLSVGRLQQNKGFHLLARALARWRERRGWTWAIAGEGPYRETIARAVSESGIADRVRWLGRLSDSALHTWYEAADLFVHPTIYEGSSIVTLEAMAHSLPVLATRAGGLPDKVEHGITGWLVPPGDPEALAAMLETAVAARDRWSSMGQAGRALALRSFDWAVAERALVDVYESVLANSRQLAGGAGRQ